MATIRRVRRPRRSVSVMTTVAVLFAALMLTGSAAGAIERVSVVGADLAPIGNSRRSVVSGDGRFVAFVAGSPDVLAGGPMLPRPNVYLRDRAAGTTELISVPMPGLIGEAVDAKPALTPDGRFVAFVATDGRPNSKWDVFVRDRLTGTTELVNVTSAGVQPGWSGDMPAISANGRYVAFESEGPYVAADTNAFGYDVYVRDRWNGTTELVSVGPMGTASNALFHDFGSSTITMSADGRRIAFGSTASNLVAGDTNGQYDLFVRDLDARTTVRVSVGTNGQETNGLSLFPMISADGRYVAFTSNASNIDGDTNGVFDVFVHDLATRRTERISPFFSSGDGHAISDDGRFVVFASNARFTVPEDQNFVSDVFVRDRFTGSLARVSSGDLGESNGHSDYASISADGSTVAFASQATNLVANDPGFQDVFVRPRGDVASVEPRPDEFKCYRSLHGDFAPRVVSVEDDFAKVDVQVVRPRRLCLAADIGDGFQRPDRHLMCYLLTQPDGSPLPDVRRPVRVENAFGTFVIRAHEAELLCRSASVVRRDVPSLPPVQQGLDGMLCYQTHGSDVNRAVTVTDQFGQARTVAVTPVRLCNPLRESGFSPQRPNRYLVCYEIPPVETGGIPLGVNDAYGYLAVSIADARQVCLPSTMQRVP
jgi:Tol biopolymer transport system component